MKQSFIYFNICFKPPERECVCPAPYSPLGLPNLEPINACICLFLYDGPPSLWKDLISYLYFFFNGLLLKQHQATTELIRELCTPPLSGSDGSKRRLQRIDGCSYALPSDTEWIKHATFQMTQSTRAKFAKSFSFFSLITQRYVHIRVYLQRRMQNRSSSSHEQYSALQALQRK